MFQGLIAGFEHNIFYEALSLGQDEKLGLK
jgi:hypothetical protein